MYLHHCSLITIFFDCLRENRSHNHGLHGTRAWVKKKKFSITSVKFLGIENVSVVTQKKFKIGTLGDFERIDFFSLFFMGERLSSGQKLFMRPHFPLIRGMFVLRSGLRFSFRALQMPNLRVRKRPF